MPFPRNWLEELVAECLQLMEYSVETGHPVHIGKPGGRREIDIFGIDPTTKKAIHVETGRARSKLALERKINQQFFNPDVKKELQDKIEGYTFYRWFVNDTYRKNSKSWGSLVEIFEKRGVTLMTFDELMEVIKKTIDGWKQKHKTNKGKLPTLPENLWLLKFLETMIDYRLIRK